MAVVNLCPDCRYGKHTACNGEALDHGVDAITECDCFLHDHKVCGECGELLDHDETFACAYGLDHCSTYACTAACGLCGPEARADAAADAATNQGRD